MELNYWIDHRRVTRDPAVGYDMLAGVIALGSAVPEKETKMEGW